MTEYISRDVIIPGSFVNEPGVPELYGFISNVTKATRHHPEGRFEVTFLDDSRRWFEVESFPPSWILVSSTNAGVVSAQKGTRKTPYKSTAKKIPYPDLAPSSAQEDLRENIAAGPASEPGLPSPPRQPGFVLPLNLFSRSNGPSNDNSPLGPEDHQRSPRKRGRPSMKPKKSSKPPSAAPSKPSSRAPSRSLSRSASFREPASLSEIDTSKLNAALEANFNSEPSLPLWQNLKNASILLLVAVPAVIAAYCVCKDGSEAGLVDTAPLTQLPSVEQLLTLSWWRTLSRQQPLTFVNLVFFFNVDVLFWLISLVQGTTWLIDPYWTLIPPLIHLYYRHHPLASSLGFRANMTSTLLWTWAIRLTHSYFRREKWQFGAREDWRFTDLSSRFGRHWVWLSFFATYITQHLMLVGLTLPFYAIHTSNAPWSWLDSLASLGAFTGILVAFVADNQLHDFVKHKQDKRGLAQHESAILDYGLWYYSRHPNYFGEQLFWWSMSLFALRLGQPWMLVGTFFNSVCMIPVTMMTESRMLARPQRYNAFKEYQARTSAWIPLPKREPHEIKAD